MMYLQETQDIVVTFGSYTLHLCEYDIRGGCLLREQGTAEGNAAVTALYPKGTRITLKGRLSPPAAQFSLAAEALENGVRGGTAVTFHIGRLVCADMRLIGYQLGLHETAAEVTLVLFTQTPLRSEVN